MASSAPDTVASLTVCATRSNFSSRVLVMKPGYAAESSTTHPPEVSAARSAGAMSNATESPAHTTVETCGRAGATVEEGSEGTDAPPWTEPAGTPTSSGGD